MMRAVDVIIKKTRSRFDGDEIRYFIKLSTGEIQIIRSLHPAMAVLLNGMDEHETTD